MSAYWFFFLELYNPVCQLNAEHTYMHFRCSPRGFSATCLQQMQGSVVEGLSQTATSGSQWDFVWDIKLCHQLTVHNTGIRLLLSTSVWVLLSPPIERWETRPADGVAKEGHPKFNPGPGRAIFLFAPTSRWRTLTRTATLLNWNSNL